MDIKSMEYIGFGPAHAQTCRSYNPGHRVHYIHARVQREDPRVECEVLDVRGGFLLVREPSGKEQWLFQHQPWAERVQVGGTVWWNLLSLVQGGGLINVASIDEYDERHALRLQGLPVWRCRQCGVELCSGDPAECLWFNPERADLFAVVAHMGEGRYVIDLQDGMARIAVRGGPLYEARPMGSIAAMGHAAYWETFEGGKVGLEELLATTTASQ